MSYEYKSKAVKALEALSSQWDEKLRKAGGIWGAVWMGIRVEVPSLLQMLDEDEGVRKELARFARAFADALEEDKDIDVKEEAGGA